jgi:hypothetical protein
VISWNEAFMLVGERRYKNKTESMYAYIQSFLSAIHAGLHTSKQLMPAGKLVKSQKLNICWHTVFEI